MAMTRRQLRRLNLPDAAIDAVLRLHEDAVSALRHERDAYQRSHEANEAACRERDDLRTQLEAMQHSQQRADALERELNDYRSRVEGEAHRRAVEAAARQALLQGGANEKAVPLLLKTLDLEALTLAPDSERGEPQLNDSDQLLSELRGAYGDFFAQPQAIGMPAMQPPTGFAQRLTRDDVRGMSAAQINENWQAVRSALSGPNE